MRARLVVVLLAVMAGALVALSVPLVRGLQEGRQEAFFLDRLSDASRFAAIAQQVGSPQDDQALRAELVRYDQVYGVPVVLLDRGGGVHLASRERVDLSGPEASGILAQALAGHAAAPGPLLMPWEQRALVVAVPVSRGGDVVGAVVTLSPTGQLRAGVLRLWLTVASADLAALLLCAFLAWRLAGWVLRPVYALDTAARRIATGRLSARAAADVGPVELRRLAMSFNSMAGAVEVAMDRQRAFVADASHQLRTPLSVLMLQLDNLRAEVDAAHAEQVTEVQDETRRLAHILDELLTLATAEHAEAAPVPTDVSALVAARCHAWETSADVREVTIRQEIGADCTALADRELVGSALDAVIHNAVKFSPPGGVVSVTVTPVEDGVEVVVSDEGPGLIDDELVRLGDRFWRSPRHQNVPGTGLGLSIARVLLQLTGADLDFAHARPHGLRAIVRLPAVPGQPPGRAVGPTPAPEHQPVGEQP